MNTSQLSIESPSINLSPDTLLYATAIFKEFTLHNQGGIKLPVLENVSLEVISCISVKLVIALISS